MQGDQGFLAGTRAPLPSFLARAHSERKQIQRKSPSHDRMTLSFKGGRAGRRPGGRALYGRRRSRERRVGAARACGACFMVGGGAAAEAFLVLVGACAVSAGGHVEPYIVLSLFFGRRFTADLEAPEAVEEGARPPGHGGHEATCDWLAGQATRLPRRRHALSRNSSTLRRCHKLAR